MSYRNTRPTSPKGRVFTAFENDGPVQAKVLGHELGLPDSKVKRWLQQWGELSIAIKRNSAVSSRVRIHAKGQWTPAVDDRVYLSIDPEKELGTCMQPGTEQSWIKWDAGYEMAVPNNHLRQSTHRKRRR